MFAVYRLSHYSQIKNIASKSVFSQRKVCLQDKVHYCASVIMLHASDS